MNNETINKAQEAINSVLSGLLLLEKEKNRIMEEYLSANNEELKIKIEKEMENSEKKYQELYKKAQALSDKIKELKRNVGNN